jgi:hypothetical protein
MPIERRRWFRAAITSGFLLTAAAPLVAQAPSATPSTAVMASLTVKADADRAQIMKAMPDEVRATVQLYLDGKIQSWYSRSDGRGVIFVMNCTTVAEAKLLTDTLPLSKANLATFEFTALSPLTPLRMLLTEPQRPTPKSNPQP